MDLSNFVVTFDCDSFKFGHMIDAVCDNLPHKTVIHDFVEHYVVMGTLNLIATNTLE